MDFLILAGIVMRVVDGSAVERERIYQGERVRAAAGNLISMEQPSTSMRVLDCQVDLYEETEEDTLRAACLRGQPVTIGGWWAGDGFEGVVDLKDVTALTGKVVDGVEVFKTLALHIEQAE